MEFPKTPQTILSPITIMLLILAIVHTCLAQDSPQDYLDPHNEARAIVGVPPLVWDDDVAAYAQDYANQRQGDCSMIHSGGPYGENLAAGYPDISAAGAVEMWVGEQNNYDYDSNSCFNGECLHYTQVVWGNSARLGCGKVYCDNGWAFITCNYDPPGNYEGERPY